ncbi:MAG TPA: hypothetical protein VGE08_02315 [Steroidobacter sp.]|uniref:hypothetical protein n=1 Tax=Steroidobacter sp. TaxID=1978227 RepID=UPI002ED77AE7
MPLERLLAGLPPLLAFAEPLAARLAGISVPALYADAGQWSTQVRAASRLLGLKTAAFGGSPCIALEAAGGAVDWATLDTQPANLADTKPSLRSTARWAAFIETLERSQADRSGGAIVACIPGPARLCSLLSGSLEDAVLARLKEVLVQMAEAVCHKRPDLLLLDEGDVLCSAPPPAAYRRSIGTLRNVTRYFDVPLGLAVSGDAASIDAAVLVQPQALIVKAKADGSLPLPNVIASAAAAVDLIGVPVNLQDGADTRARLASARNDLPRANWLLMNVGELPAQTNIESLHRLVADLGAA